MGSRGWKSNVIKETDKQGQDTTDKNRRAGPLTLLRCKDDEKSDQNSEYYYGRPDNRHWPIVSVGGLNEPQEKMIHSVRLTSAPARVN